MNETNLFLKVFSDSLSWPIIKNLNQFPLIIYLHEYIYYLLRDTKLLFSVQNQRKNLELSLS